MVLDTGGMTWEEWFADTDPRVEKLEPKLLPGCEKRDQLLGGELCYEL